MRNLFVLLISITATVSICAQSPNPKRGISFEGGTIQVADIEAMSGKLSWYYNWGTHADSNVEGILAEHQVEYIPMTWNEGFNEEDLRTFYTNHPESKYLLGFNEPNFTYQANLTPTEAAEEWPRLEALAAEFSLEIVGPAVNWCDECVSEGGVTFYDPYEYLDSFFIACPDCQVDYVAVHNYMCYNSALVSFLEGFHKYGKKIWLTEYACWDQETITLSMQKNLMLNSLDYMDNDTMIFRYAWFMARSGSGTPHIDIFTDDGGVTTELGDIYLNFDSRHDSLDYIEIPGRIEAEKYAVGEGVQLEETADFDGIANVGWIDAGDWMQYNIEVPSNGQYYLYMRVAATSSTSVDIWVDDEVQSIQAEISSTGGWQNWNTISIPLILNQGKSKIKFTTENGGFNINWIVLSDDDNTAPTVDAGEDKEVLLPQTTVELSGTIQDEDGDDLEIKWEKRSGGECNIQSQNSSSTSVEGLSAGIYTFRLSVSDGIDVVYDDVKVTVIDPSSVAQHSKTNFIIYPNPVIDQATIMTPVGVESHTVEVLSATGQVLYTEETGESGEQVELDFSRFQNGIYLIKLCCNNHVQTFRLIK